MSALSAMLYEQFVPSSWWSVYKCKRLYNLDLAGPENGLSLRDHNARVMKMLNDNKSNRIINKINLKYYSW